MIVLLTDFGADLYVGQMKAVLYQRAPAVPVIDLCHQVPAFDIRGAACLLAAWSDPRFFPAGTVFLAVVDPGVGGDRPAVAVESEGRWFVGPGNGLFEYVCRQASVPARHYLLPPPASPPSASFHGRDWFAPVAAGLATGASASQLGLIPTPALRCPDWPDNLPQILFIDHYGNLMTGLQASAVPPDSCLDFAGQRLARARTFCDVPPGTAFFYTNSCGLIEIAVSQGSAAAKFAAAVGNFVRLI